MIWIPASSSILSAACYRKWQQLQTKTIVYYTFFLVLFFFTAEITRLQAETGVWLTYILHDHKIDYNIQFLRPVRRLFRVVNFDRVCHISRQGRVILPTAFCRFPTVKIFETVDYFIVSLSFSPSLFPLRPVIFRKWRKSRGYFVLW